MSEGVDAQDRDRLEAGSSQSPGAGGHCPTGRVGTEQAVWRVVRCRV